MSSNITVKRGLNRSVRVERWQFAGGEEHIRLDTEPFGSDEVVHLFAHIRSSADVMALLLLTDAVRRHGTQRIWLWMPYLPYARQDRVCARGESLSLAVFCELINSQGYEYVEVWDVHSDVAPALLKRCEVVPPEEFLENAVDLIDWEKTLLVAPDAGALKKTAKVASYFCTSFIRADKTRDAKTGAITGTVVHSEHVGNSDLLIVDDICDGGRTFIELARELRKLTTGRVMLYVTHGIFSRGTQVFDGLIDRVFCANPFVEQMPANFIHLTDTRS